MVDVTLKGCKAGSGLSKPLTGGWTCLPCEEGTYNIHNSSGVCKACPFGARCVATTVLSQEGFWVMLNESDNNAQAYECPVGYCLADNRCAPNRQGLLCGECQEGFAESATSTCIGMPPPFSVAAPLILV